jgi:hypothetical protein
MASRWTPTGGPVSCPPAVLRTARIRARRLAAALDADVRITAGDDLGSAGFETHAA